MNFLHGAGGVAAGGGGYTTTAKDYDGSTNYATRASLAGAANSKQFIFSAWLRVDGGAGSNRYILLSGNSDCVFVILDNSNKIEVDLFDTGAVHEIAFIQSTSTIPVGASWVNVLVSGDASVPNSFLLYINDVLDKTVNPTNFSIGYTDTNWFVGANNGGTTTFNGCLSEVFMHSGYLDLSVTANRRKFISATGKPVDLGADGSTPLGVQPLIYFKNGDPSVNSGSGGNFTNNAALSACSSSPSD